MGQRPKINSDLNKIKGYFSLTLNSSWCKDSALCRHQGPEFLLSCSSISGVLFWSAWSQDCLQQGKHPCCLFFSLGQNAKIAHNAFTYISLARTQLQGHISGRTEMENIMFFQAYMCLAKILLLVKKGRMDSRGQPVARDLNYSRSSCFGSESRKTGACSPSGRRNDSSNFGNHKETNIRHTGESRIKQIPGKNIEVSGNIRKFWIKPHLKLYLQVFTYVSQWIHHIFWKSLNWDVLVSNQDILSFQVRRGKREREWGYRLWGKWWKMPDGPEHNIWTKVTFRDMTGATI